jgi:hypothetical protein
MRLASVPCQELFAYRQVLADFVIYRSGPQRSFVMTCLQAPGGEVSWNYV